MNKEMARKDSGIWTEKRVWKDSFRFSLSFNVRIVPSFNAKLRHKTQAFLTIFLMTVFR